MKRRTGLLVICLGFFQLAFGQQDTIYNTNSPMYKTPERIAYYEQLYRFRVTRFIDLGERQNKGFNSAKSNLGGLIVNLIKQKKIGPFMGFGDPAEFESPLPDSTALFLNDNFALSNTRGYYSPTESYQAGEKVVVTETDKDGVTDDIVYQAMAPVSGKSPSATSSEWQNQGPMKARLDVNAVAGIDIIEDVIFDKRKSRLTYDILAIGVDVLDQSTGQIQPRFFVRYSDVVTEIEKLYKSKKVADRNSVVWQNRYNPSENKKFTDALKLRLFHGVIKRVENPDNKDIQDIIYDKNTGRGSYAEAVFARWEKEMEMMEKEHNLWEF